MGIVAARCGDHFVGHYQGVLPTSAELALDRAISSGADGAARTGRGVIEEFTPRRWLVEHLGVVTFFPVSHPGATEGGRSCRSGVWPLVNHGRAVLLWGVGGHPVGVARSVTAAATVLFGSGAGTLEVDQAALRCCRESARRDADTRPLSPDTRRSTGWSWSNATGLEPTSCTMHARPRCRPPPRSSSTCGTGVEGAVWIPDVVVLIPGVTGSVFEQNGREVCGMSGRAVFEGVRTFGRSIRSPAITGADDLNVDSIDGVVATKIMPACISFPAWARRSTATGRWRAI